MRHLDEGTIHAWLDGALDAAAAARAQAHAAECAECAARVAEARGLIAASSRILAALDDVPAGAVPATGAVPAAAERALPTAHQPLHRRRWSTRNIGYAAAAVLLVGVTALVAERNAHRAPADGRVLTSQTSAEAATPFDAAEPVAAAPAPPPTPAAIARPMRVGTRGVAADTVGIAVGGGTAASVGNAAGLASAEARAARAEDVSSASSSAADVGRVAAARERDVPAARQMAASVTPRLDSLTIERLAQNQVRADAPAPPRPEQRRRAARPEEGYAAESSLPATATAQVARDLLGRRSGAAAADSQRVALADTASSSVAPGAAPAPVAPTARAVLKAEGAPAPRLLTRVTEPRGADVAVRSTYLVQQGVTVTLLDEPATVVDAAPSRDADRSARVELAPPAAPSAAPPTRTITWTDAGRRYTLSGPLSDAELQALKTRMP